MVRYAALALALLAASAGARMRLVGLLELATGCDVVVHGRVKEVGERTATIEVVRSFRRELPKGPIVVSPNTLRVCGGLVPNFTVGEEVVVFLAAHAGGPFEVICGGQGKVAIAEGKVAEVVAAAAKVVEIAGPDEDARNRAMIGFAASDNATLRSEARLHISRELFNSKLRTRYRESLVALLDGAHAETRTTGLIGLRLVKAPEAVERMIALTGDADLGVVEAASMALAEYDTAATVEAIARLTRHENQSVRRTAVLDLRESTRLEALEALLAVPDDPVPEVRKAACAVLIGWLRRKEGASAARVAILMVEDASPAALAAAAKTSWEARNPELVEPLARLLRDAKPGGAVEAASLESLRQIQRQAGDEGKQDVEAHLDLVRRSLRRGTGGTAPVEILGEANDVEDLRWAAREHADAAVRGLAQSILARQPK